MGAGEVVMPREAGYLALISLQDHDRTGATYTSTVVAIPSNGGGGVPRLDRYLMSCIELGFLQKAPLGFFL